MTNSLSVFNLLEAREGCDLCLVGGMYRRRTAAFVGPTAEDALRALGIDAAFIGANGILDGDVSTSKMDEGRIQQLAFSKADTDRLGIKLLTTRGKEYIDLTNDPEGAIDWIVQELAK